MTPEEIQEAAKEATNNQPIYGRKEFTFSSEELTRFAAIIEKRTIERCAAICDSVNNYDNPMSATDCAAAIESYKEGLLKEVGEPVAKVEQHARMTSQSTTLDRALRAGTTLFTSDQVTAAILKATKPLIEEIGGWKKDQKENMDLIFKQQGEINELRTQLAARIAELEAEVTFWQNDRNELQQKDDEMIKSQAERIGELEEENARLNRAFTIEQAISGKALTRQRDLAVEAMQMAVEMIETNAHERRHVRWKLQDALSTIKESEGK